MIATRAITEIFVRAATGALLLLTGGRWTR
jgi:hypothetical protein